MCRGIDTFFSSNNVRRANSSAALADLTEGDVGKEGKTFVCI